MTESWDRPSGNRPDDAYPPTAQYGQHGPPAPPFPAGYPAPGYGPAPFAPPTSGRATTIMILGIASLALLVLCAGLGVIPGVIAVIMAGSAQREIEASGGRLGGLGILNAGKIMSWIGIGLNVLVVVGFLLFFLVLGGLSYV